MAHSTVLLQLSMLASAAHNTILLQLSMLASATNSTMMHQLAVLTFHTFQTLSWFATMFAFFWAFVMPGITFRFSMCTISKFMILLMHLLLHCAGILTYF